MNIEYDWYFAGNAFFEVLLNNNLIVKYGLQPSYRYKIIKKNNFFYCHLINDNCFLLLGKIDYFDSKLILTNKSKITKDDMRIMIVEKLMIYSKEEDYNLINNNFTIQSLCCFLCGKNILTPYYPFGFRCGKNYGQYATGMV